MLGHPTSSPRVWVGWHGPSDHRLPRLDRGVPNWVGIGIELDSWRVSRWGIGMSRRMVVVRDRRGEDENLQDTRDEEEQ